MEAHMMTSAVDYSVLREIWDGGVGKAMGLKDEDLDVMLGLANAKMNAGDTQAALKFYRSLVLCSPGTFRFQQGLANCCLKAGEFEAAAIAAAAMIAIEGRNPLGYYFSGAACLALGYRREAKEDIAEALSIADAGGSADLRIACLRLTMQLDAGDP